MILNLLCWALRTWTERHQTCGQSSVSCLLFFPFHYLVRLLHYYQASHNFLTQCLELQNLLHLIKMWVTFADYDGELRCEMLYKYGMYVCMFQYLVFWLSLFHSFIVAHHKLTPKVDGWTRERGHWDVKRYHKCLKSSNRFWFSYWLLTTSNVCPAIHRQSWAV